MKDFLNVVKLLVFDLQSTLFFLAAHQRSALYVVEAERALRDHRYSDAARNRALTAALLRSCGTNPKRVLLCFLFRLIIGPTEVAEDVIPIRIIDGKRRKPVFLKVPCPPCAVGVPGRCK